MKYQFCFQIDRQICFNREHLQSCTVGNNTKNQSLLFIKENYNGEPIDWDKFFEEREAIKQDCKEGKMLSNCEGCHFLEDLEWDCINTKREFKTVQLSHYLKCNSNCIYCGNHTEYNPKDKTPDTYNSVPIIKDMLDKGYINQNTHVDFAGGEPTLYYKFEELLNLLIKNNVKDIIVHSNVILYSKAIELGIKLGFVSICVSIDAGTKETHEKVKRVKSFNKVWKHIKKYAKVKNPIFKNRIELKYIIIPNLNDSEKEIELWIDKAIKAGVNNLVLNADNNIFIQEHSQEDKERMLKRVVELSDFFVKKVREKNIKYRTEFNVNSAYKILNRDIPFDI